MDGGTLIDDIAWPSAVVEVLGIEWYAHEAVEGGGQVAGGDGAVSDGAAVGFGASDDLAMSKSSAGEAHGHHVWPVVAAIGATLGAHEGSSSEFTHGNDEGLVEEASFFEIGDEGGEEMVEEREQGLEATADASVRWNVIAVGIPGTARGMVAEIEGDEGDTGFDEASCEEGLLAPEV